MVPPKPNDPITARAELSNIALTHTHTHNNIKNYFMKTIDALKEEIKISLKETKKE